VGEGGLRARIFVGVLHRFYRIAFSDPPRRAPKRTALGSCKTPSRWTPHLAKGMIRILVNGRVAIQDVAFQGGRRPGGGMAP